MFKLIIRNNVVTDMVNVAVEQMVVTTTCYGSATRWLATRLLSISLFFGLTIKPTALLQLVSRLVAPICTCVQYLRFVCDNCRHAGVWTAEEVTKVCRDKLLRLRSLYMAQFERLKHVFKNKRRKYLVATKSNEEGKVTELFWHTEKCCMIQFYSFISEWIQ